MLRIIEINVNFLGIMDINHKYTTEQTMNVLKQ
jgi:hypothetical protein